MDCCVKNCDDAGYAKSLCRYHYERNRAHGTPVPQPKTKSPCAFDGCKHIQYGRLPLCKAHYAQERAGQALAPLGPRRTAYPIIDGTRQCLDCGVTKPIDQFYRVSNAKSGYRPTCGKCVSAANMGRRVGDTA